MENDKVSFKHVKYDGKYLYPSDLVEKPDPYMPLIESIVTRRTVRNYRQEPVPYELFEELIKIAMNAPTACNEQKWKVVYIDDKNLLQEIYERGGAAFIRNVNQAFILFYNSRIDNIEYRDDLQSGAAFINTFSLIAHSYGIGSCWVAHLPNRRELSRLLNSHRQYKPVALVTFGYYKEKVKLIPRKKDSGDIISSNTFNFKLVLHENRNIFLRRIFRWIYYKIPSVIRKKIRKYSIPYEKKFYFENYD